MARSSTNLARPTGSALLDVPALTALGYSPRWEALFDTDTAASDDFYRFVNGGWLDANLVPSEYSSWGAPEVVNDRNQRLLRKLLQDAAAQTGPRGPVSQMAGGYVAAAMDEEAIAAVGIGALEPLLERIDAAMSVAEVRDISRHLHRCGPSPFHSLGIAPDFEDSNAYLVYAGQGGLGLPEREYYTRADEASVALREAYVTHVSNQLGNLGGAKESARETAARARLRDASGGAILHRRARA